MAFNSVIVLVSQEGVWDLIRHTRQEKKVGRGTKFKGNHMWMWHLGTRLSFGSADSVIPLDDLGGIFQPKQFYDSLKCRYWGWFTDGSCDFQMSPASSRCSFGRILSCCFWSAHGSKHQQTTKGNKIQLVKDHSNTVMMFLLSVSWAFLFV